MSELEVGHAEVGRAVDAWSNLEGCLSFVFSNLIQVDIKLGDAVLTSHTSSVSQCNLIARILPLLEMPESMRDRISVLCQEFKDLSQERNKIVHAVWVYDDEKLIYRVATSTKVAHAQHLEETGKYAPELLRDVNNVKMFRTKCEALNERFTSLFYEESEFLKLFPVVLPESVG